MILEHWQQEELDQAIARAQAEDPVRCHMHGTRYLSRSNGRGRKPRKPRLVELANWTDGRWTWKVPWDELATEFLGEHAEGQQLKDRFIEQLNRGKF